jgi:hypothetical protein
MEFFSHKTPNKLTVWDATLGFWVISFFLAIAGAYVMLFNASVTTLTCERQSPTQGNCKLVETNLQVPQVQEIPLNTLQQAKVISSFSGRSTSHRLFLLNQTGYIAFPRASGLDKLESIAAQINAFIRNRNSIYIKVTQDDRLEGFISGLFLWGLGAVIVLFNHAIEYLRCEFDKNKGFINLKQGNLIRYGVIHQSIDEIDSVTIETIKHSRLTKTLQYVYFNKYRLVLILKSGDRIPLTSYDTQILIGKEKVVEYIATLLKNPHNYENFKPKPSPELEKLKHQAALEQEIVIWQEAIRTNPNNAEAHYHLGMAFYRHHQRQEATESLQRARDLFKTQGNSHKAAQVQDFLWQLGLD